MNPLPNAFRLDGRRIVITGAAGGIGAATARICASLGAEPVLVDVAPLEQVLEEVRVLMPKARSFRTDAASREALAEVAREVGDVHAVIAAAAICPMDDWLTSPDWDSNFQRAMEVNVLGPLNAARVWLPPMMARGRGAIVVIGSLAGITGGVAHTNQPHYVGSKAAVHSFVRWLSRRAIRHGVNVNGVAPGPVRTNMNRDITFDEDALPMKRLGRPEEIGWPCAFLCSDAASYLSGAILDVNGGTYVG